jgi:glycolate oxidase iron-sulfur subunit
VPYGRLLEATRETLTVTRPLHWKARLVLAVFARERTLRWVLALARLARGFGIARFAAAVLPRALAMPAAMLAATARPARGSRRNTTHAAATAHSATAVPTASPDRGTAALLTGCVMEGLFTNVNRATERVLERNGFRMGHVPGQQCCGALHAHAGDAETARTLARANIAAFESSGAEWIVLNSAGCGAMCREYAHLLQHDTEWAARATTFASRVRDVHELLAEAGPERTPPADEPRRVAWDAPCHLQHAQRVVAPPLAVLRAIGGATLVPLAGSDQCCGSAGIFTLVQPQVSARVLDPKLRHIAESGADVVATANPGCLMQIGGGLLLEGSDVVARHPVELLDEGYAAQGPTG